MVYQYNGWLCITIIYLSIICVLEMIQDDNVDVCMEFTRYRPSVVYYHDKIQIY